MKMPWSEINNSKCKDGKKTGPESSQMLEYVKITAYQLSCLSCILAFQLNHYRLSSLLLFITNLSGQPLTGTGSVIEMYTRS